LGSLPSVGDGRRVHPRPGLDRIGHMDTVRMLDDLEVKRLLIRTAAGDA
jgi:hypothetical protein